MSYKRKEKSVREIAKELGVSSVIEGSVRKADNKIRATIQLIDAATEEHLWSSRYDRDVDDIFSLQTEIADKVVKALTKDGPMKTTSLPNHDVLAYTMLMRANQLLHGEGSPTESNLREALALFEAAVSRDPGFARANAGVARAWFHLANNGYEQFTVMKEKAFPAAARSVELGPDEPDTHLAMAQILMAQDKFEAVRSELEKALRLNPSMAEAHFWLGEVQMNLDTPAVAIKSFESAMELDPLSLDHVAGLAMACHATGRNARALEVLQRASQLHPKSWWPQVQLARYYMWNKDYAYAQRYIDKVGELGAGEAQAETIRVGVQGLLYAMTERRAEAKEAIRYLERMEHEEARLQGIFPIASALGDLDQAFACLMRLAETGAWGIAVKYLDHYSTLRQDPRYQEFCKKVGIHP